MADTSERLQRIALELSLPEQILEIMKDSPRPRKEGAAKIVLPRSPMEHKMAGIWGEFLGLEVVGVEEDFFALGGHSLMATQILARIREVFGVELPIGVLFMGTFTVAALAEQIEMAQIAQAGDDQVVEVLDAVGRLSDSEVEVMLREGGLK